MELNLEVIKLLLGEAQKVSNEYANKLPTLNVNNIKHLTDYVKSDFTYNNLKIMEMSNPLQQILNNITHAMCVDICSKEDQIVKFVDMIRSFINNDVDYSINNKIIYMVNNIVNGNVIGNGIIGVSGTTLNQYGLNQDVTLNTTLSVPNGTLGSTGNKNYDEFLDDIKNFFVKNKIRINANTSLSVFTNEYSKFLKVNKKTLPETNGAVIYDQYMNRFYPDSESK